MRDILEKLQKENVIDTEGLSPDILKRICESECAYRLGQKKLVSRQHLKDLVLQDVKANEKPTFSTRLCGLTVSKHVIDLALASLHSDGMLLFTEDSGYIINLDGIVSEESVRAICEYRADSFQAKNVVKDLGFNWTIDRSNGSFSIPVETEAAKCCKNILNSLLQKGYLVHDPVASDFFSWNFVKN